jgi:hypothetical protein
MVVPFRCLARLPGSLIEAEQLMGAAACTSCVSSQTDSCLAWRAFRADWQPLNERLQGGGVSNHP